MSGGSAPRKLTLADLDRFLRRPDQSDGLTGYLDAAAVLVAFDPFRLRPVGDGGAAPTGTLLEGLLPVCEQVGQGPLQGLWALTASQRRAALERLVEADGLGAALDANPERPDTALQRLFEQLVRRQPIKLEHRSREELAGLFTLHDWVDGIIEGVPARTEVQAALTRFDLLAPMRALADDGFVGREGELDQLETYFRDDDPRPLFVFGPGGIGKSTLLARLILDRVVADGLPVAYVDLDRPTIRADQPATLLIDAIAQLEPQIGLSSGEAESLTKELAYSIGRGGDADRAFESAQGPEDWTIGLFGSAIGGALGDRRALMVVDTFEEAQFLGPEVVWRLVTFLVALGEAVPRLRLVLAGRVLPREYHFVAFPEMVILGSVDPIEDPMVLEQIPLPARPINLGVLDQESARMLLRRATQSAGSALTDADLDDVIGVVSRNPMCLKLAGRLLREEGVEKLRESRAEFLSGLRAEKIQALLYGRILRHVHDDDARAIAYPGLVVRRLAPDVIREVLAGPCELHLTTERDEYAIFTALAAEAALVEYDPVDGSLRQRPDVRRAMLPDVLDQVDPEVIEAIDDGAIQFYARRSDAVSRGEEIYHRLRRCDSEEILESRWLPDAESRLKNAGEELLAQQRLWLAGKLGVTLDESVRQEASQEAWERQTAMSVDRFLRSRAPDEALRQLRDRSERLPRSKLYFLEAEGHRLAGSPDEALRVARAGVNSASTAGAIDMALELLLQMVVIEEGRRQLEAADRLLEEARSVAANSANDVLRFRVTVTKLRLHRQLLPDAHEERAELRRSASAQLTDDLMRALRARPVLLREAAAELAKEEPRITSLAIETLGIEVGSDAQAAAFGQAIVNFDKTQVDLTLGPSLAQGVQQFQDADFDTDVIRQYVTKELTARDTRELGDALASTPAGTVVLNDFRTYFRAGVDDIVQGKTIY